MGKGGVGKSSTINSLIGEQVVRVTAFQVSISFICSLHSWVVLSCCFRFHKLQLSLHLFGLQSEGLRPVMASRSWAGFTLNVIDTPGLVEAGYVNHQALELIKGSVVELSSLS